jgi:hypothetical protein
VGSRKHAPYERKGHTVGVAETTRLLKELAG